jgi:isoleucyl-tRNA synthetase
MRRVDDVIDAWFDSGSMPFAQHHYPFDRARAELVAPNGTFRPADFIAEAVDQTRGWFYTLHVLACALFDGVAFRNCIVMGHVNDEQGRKMSKRLGNVVDPIKVLEETGADALRWYFYVSDPEQPSRFSARLVREAAQNFLIPLWNAVSFFTIYANIDGWRPGRKPPIRPEARPFLDRWVLGRLGNTINVVTERLESYQITGSAKVLEEFVDDLTNWYIRRSRNRFWAGTESDDKESAYQTLYTVLTTLPRLLAPFMPFVAESMQRHLVTAQDPSAPESVHLAAWPVRSDSEGLAEAMIMKGVQRIVALGRTSRGAHNIKTRQPLARAFVVTRSEAEREELERELAGHLDLIRDELNVKGIVFAANRSEFVRFEVRPNFRVLGKRIGGQMKAVQAALQAADGDTLAAELERFGFIELSLGAEQGDNVQLAEADLEVRLIEREGTATANDGELLVALDATLTPDLIAEGRAREIVSRIQAERKEQNLDYTDRIRVHYRAAAEIEQALAAHREHVQGETLAVAIAPADARGDLKQAPIDELDFAFAIERLG